MSEYTFTQFVTNSAALAQEVGTVGVANRSDITGVPLSLWLAKGKVGFRSGTFFLEVPGTWQFGHAPFELLSPYVLIDIVRSLFPRLQDAELEFDAQILAAMLEERNKVYRAISGPHYDYARTVDTLRRHRIHGEITLDMLMHGAKHAGAVDHTR